MVIQVSQEYSSSQAIYHFSKRDKLLINMDDTAT